MTKRFSRLLLAAFITFVCTFSQAQLFTRGQLLTASALNSAFSQYLPLTGGTLSGSLTATGITGTPISGSTGSFTTLSAAADSSIATTTATPLTLSRNGGTLTNQVIKWLQGPTTPYWAAGAGADGSWGVAQNTAAIDSSSIFKVSSSGVAVAGAITSTGDHILGATAAIAGTTTALSIGNSPATSANQTINIGAGQVDATYTHTINMLTSPTSYGAYVLNIGSTNLGNSSSVNINGGLSVTGQGNVNLGATYAANGVSISSNQSNGWRAMTSFIDSSGTPTVIGQVGLTAASHDLYLLNYTSSNLIFGTNGAEKARIDGSGNLLVNESANGLQNKNGISLEPQAGGAYAVVNHASGTASGQQYVFFGYNGTNIGSIAQSGTTAVLYNTTSDRRLKKNIHDAGPASELVDDIRIRTFDWRSDDSHQRYGVIAQELDEVYPEAVSKPADPEAMMAVDYSKLVPLLVKEVQDLRKRVSALERTDCRFKRRHHRALVH